ncbi:XrtA/PEP-CTERM system TPR-repeat protein PrsT [Glaciecola sp. MF2-115]|uniref:XrtA/PEP-CTERM system TPR-repeat protein PrsT n=1 Tax=Glaciecola sp. MF2-115 TaxID=3384827 RepID=UPI00399EFAEF
MRYLSIFLLVMSGILLSGCSKDLPEDYIKRGNLAAKQENYSVSVIELKNAAVEYPEHAQIRYLLASYYLKTGDIPGATKEFYRALELGYDASEIVPDLLVVLRLQEFNDDILALANEELSLSPEASVALDVYEGLANFRLENKDEAIEQLMLVVENSEKSKYKSVARAYLHWDQDDINLAMSAIEDALNIDPEMIEALTIKAQVLLVENKHEEALVPLIKLYKNKVKGNFVDILIANTYMQLGDIDNARKHIDYLVTNFPGIAYAQQLKGILEFKSNNYELAKIHSEKAIQSGGDNPAGRVLAGLSNFHLENYEQANRHFSVAGDAALRDKSVSKAYAITQLKLGSNEEAKASFLSLSDLSSDDAKLFSFAGEQLLSAGLPEDAKSMLDIASGLKNSDEKERFRQGILGLKLSDLNALKDLEELVAENTEYPQASYALANYYQRNGDLQKAIDLGEKLKNERADQVDGYEISAIAYLKLKDKTKARENFLKVLEIEESNANSLLFLAGEAVLNKNIPEAESLLERLLDAQPKQMDALIKYFEVSIINENTEKAVKRIETAFNKDQSALIYRILYAQALAKTGAPEKVINILSAVPPSKTTPSMYFITLGDSYMISGQGEAAVSLYEDWKKLQPNEQYAYVKTINSYEQLGAITKALNLSLSAANRFRDQAIFKMLVVHFRVLNNEYAKAQSVLSTLPEEIRGKVTAQGLQGQIWLKQGRPEKALPLLINFYNYKPSFIKLTHVIDSYGALGYGDEPVEFIEKHLESFENDILARMLLADILVWINPSRAIEEYLSIVEQNNKNAYAWNNLAWLMYVQNEYTKAEEYGAKALDLLPQDPEVLDTYGMILLKLGKYQEALPFIEQAYKSKSKSLSIYLHYAEALIVNGQKQRAWGLLDVINSNDKEILQEVERLKAI